MKCQYILIYWIELNVIKCICHLKRGRSWLLVLGFAKAASSGVIFGFWFLNWSVCNNLTDVGLDSILQKSRKWKEIEIEIGMNINMMSNEVMNTDEIIFEIINANYWWKYD